MRSHSFFDDWNTAGFFRPEAPSKTLSRTLTFPERVAYQRAIEDIYWRHRIWPKERPDSKPPLDAVMSQAQIEQKVTGYLRKLQALADYGQRPITAEQLQAEMDRERWELQRGPARDEPAGLGRCSGDSPD